MKKVLLIVFAGFSIFLACKKDKSVTQKSFDQIVESDIKAYEDKLSVTNLVVSDDMGTHLLDAGSVLFYKTQNGTLGKMKIVGVSDQNVLTVDIVNYDAAGNITLNQSGLTIDGTLSCDLDLGQQTTDNLIRDFKWAVVSANKREIQPFNAAVFYVYAK